MLAYKAVSRRAIAVSRPTIPRFPFFCSRSFSRLAARPVMTDRNFPLNTGATIPALGLGTWKSPPGQVAAAVENALTHGYRLIDGAYAYDNEQEVGQGLRAAFAKGVRREDVFVVSKVWVTYNTRVALALDKTLASLGLDYVDLFLVHWPVLLNPAGNDDKLPTRPDGARDVVRDHDHVATWRQMEALSRSKARAVGVSNYSVRYLDELLAACATKPAVNQIECHPALPQPDVLARCRAEGIHVMAYSPFGSTGGPLFTAAPVVRVAAKHGVAPAAVLLGYHVARGRTVVPKSVTPARIAANAAPADLDADDLRQLDAYGEALAASGQLQRFIYPPFGVDLGFPDRKK